MELPERILNRAEDLLDEESRRLLALQQQLQDETEKAKRKQLELDQLIEGAKERNREADQVKAELQEEIKRVQEGKIDDFIGDIREKEIELEKLLRQAEELLINSQVSKNTVVKKPSESVDETKSEKSKESVIHDVRKHMKKLRVSTEEKLAEIMTEDI